jgi:transcriptional regulator with XRE-family HTH domain
MKQPELGKKISELRKDKGLTQEELVEKCNINVRTLQRIEAGEVTPRSYTVKTILAALEYDLSKISCRNAITDNVMKSTVPGFGL